MKFRIACHKPSTNSFFEDEIDISSEVFDTPEAQVEAIRRMYRESAPTTDVLLIKRLDLVETSCY